MKIAVTLTGVTHARTHTSNSIDKKIVIKNKDSFIKMCNF